MVPSYCPGNPKVKEPPTFKGDRSADLPAWTRKMENALHFVKGQFGTSKETILSIGGYLEEEADIRFQSYQDLANVGLEQ